MILYFEKKWKSGSVIPVKFLNGDERIRDKVIYAAQRLITESGANISFGFVKEDVYAPVRIFFGQPTVSQIGTDYLHGNPGEPNLFFTETYANALEEWKILHEFGHVLGMVHEIFHPQMPFSLNEKAMEKHYMNLYGFTKEQYEANIGVKTLPNELHYSGFDENSIMMYPVPAECNDSGKQYIMPQDLSEDDIINLKMFYPDEEVEITQLKQGVMYESSIVEPGQQYFFSFRIVPEEEKRYVIGTESSEYILISLFVYKENEFGYEYIDYLKPKSSENYQGEAAGSNAEIELTEYDYKPEFGRGEVFYIRLRHLLADGTGTFKILVRDKYA